MVTDKDLPRKKNLTRRGYLKPIGRKYSQGIVLEFVVNDQPPSNQQRIELFDEALGYQLTKSETKSH